MYRATTNTGTSTPRFVGADANERYRVPALHVTEPDLEADLLHRFRRHERPKVLPLGRLVGGPPERERDEDDEFRHSQGV